LASPPPNIFGWDFGDFVLGDFGDFSVFWRKESDDGMIKMNYFDERELLVRREIETKTPKCYRSFLVYNFIP